VPSEPVMVNIVVFICCCRLKLVAKVRKKAETHKDVPLSVKENAVLKTNYGIILRFYC